MSSNGQVVVNKKNKIDSEYTTKQHQTNICNNSDETKAKRIYHETQSKQLCALHALNNLFQSSQAFKKKDLDTICNDLAPKTKFFNPHKSAFGLGCYDVNVIIAALAKKNYDVVWFDKRKALSLLNLEKIFGFILNIPNYASIPFSNYLPWSSEKHWICVRKIYGYYYDLDSKLYTPSCIGKETDLIQYLEYRNRIDPIEILIIVPKQTSNIYKVG